MNKILVTLLALIGGSCISFAQMETGRVSDTAEDTLRIENEIVAVDTGFYQSVVRYDTVRYNLKMQSVYKKAFQLKNDVFVEKMKEPWLDDIRHYKIFCVNAKYGIQYGFRIFYLIALQNEENYEREESCSA